MLNLYQPSNEGNLGGEEVALFSPLSLCLADTLMAFIFVSIRQPYQGPELGYS